MVSLQSNDQHFCHPKGRLLSNSGPGPELSIPACSRRWLRSIEPWPTRQLRDWFRWAWHGKWRGTGNLDFLSMRQTKAIRHRWVPIWLPAFFMESSLALQWACLIDWPALTSTAKKSIWICNRRMMPSFANKWRKRLSSCLLELMSAGLTSLTSSWSSIIHPDFRDPRPLGRLERIKRPEELFRSISFAAGEPILTQRSKSKMRFLHICAIINVLEHGRWMNSSCSHGLCVTHMFAWNLAEVASTDLLWTRSPYRVYNPFCHTLRLPQAFGLSPLVQPRNNLHLPRPGHSIVVPLQKVTRQEPKFGLLPGWSHPVRIGDTPEMVSKMCKPLIPWFLGGFQYWRDLISAHFITSPSASYSFPEP